MIHGWSVYKVRAETEEHSQTELIDVPLLKGIALINRPTHNNNARILRLAIHRKQDENFIFATRNESGLAAFQQLYTICTVIEAYCTHSWQPVSYDSFPSRRRVNDHFFDDMRALGKWLLLKQSKETVSGAERVKVLNALRRSVMSTLEHAQWKENLRGKHYWVLKHIPDWGL
jgi:hypothetical protein